PCNLGQGYLIVLVFNSLFYKMRILITIAIIIITIVIIIVLPHRTLEEGMATHSSILAWRIPWMEEPGGLQSMGWQRVRQG
ncbi:hypothetical protein Q6316_27810, partial [Klebsiella pneumoniae]|uniref:hypothetical protein n=1 Tax=Klebsiella pneumoniae TaxID=573 RepID=UPI0027302FB7